MRLRILGRCCLQGVVTVAALSVLPGAARGQKSNTQLSLPPYLRSGDFLQSLGISARSIGMGDAYSALADDASATFWNPGRLSVLQTRQFMVEYHSVPLITSADISRSSLPPQASIERTFSAGAPQLSFAGGVWPLEFRKHRYAPPADPNKSDSADTSGKTSTKPDPDTDYVRSTPYGHIGLSYALGGYFHDAYTSYQRDATTSYLLDTRSYIPGAGPIPNPALVAPVTDGTLAGFLVQKINGKDVPVIYDANTGQPRTLKAGEVPQKATPVVSGGTNTLIREQYYTLAYGNRAAVRYSKRRIAQLGYGVGLVVLNYSQNINTVSEVTAPAIVFAPAGSGVGYIAGLSYGFGPDDRAIRFGLTYRSGIKINYSDADQEQAAGFATEVPSRLSFGVAYDSHIRHDDFRVTTEIQSFSDANRGTVLLTDPSTGVTAPTFSQQDLRAAVANVHFGMEYVRNLRPGMSIPFRFGFRTNKGAAIYTSFDTTVTSFGTGIQIKDSNNNQLFNLETAAEVIAPSAVTLWTVTALFRF